MPECYKSEKNRPVILVNNAWDQLSLKTKEFLRRPSFAYQWEQDQSPWLTLSSWPALEVHKHIPQQKRGGSYKNNFIFLFPDVYSYLCYTHIAITEAILDWSSSTELNTGVCLPMSKSRVKKIIRRNSTRGAVTCNLHDRMHLKLKGEQSIVSFRFKENMHGAVTQKGNRIPNVLKDVEFLRPQRADNSFTNNSLIMIFTLHNDVLWQIAYDHKVIQSLHVGCTDITKI